MLLSELEPGSLFKLTANSQAGEIARMGAGRASMVPTPGFIFELLAPQSGINEPIIAVAGPGNSPGLMPNFYPDGKIDYEVERVEAASGLGKRNLAGRAYLMTSCDPEIFLENEAGQIVPGFSVVPPKKTPFVSTGGGLFHEDGFQGEFSPAPFSCHERVVTSMTHTLQDMLGHINGMGLAYNSHGEPRWLNYATMPIKISDKSFVELSPELLASGTDDQVALGCDTSENVWGHVPFTHDNPRQFPYRMAGGHIHFGTPATAPWLHARAERIIKAMDVFCGVPSVALFADMDDPRRRQFYGRAGEYRLQKHGLEYRTLSNAWLQHPSLTHLTFNLARAAFRIGMMDWEGTFKFDSGLVRHIINEHDVDAAKKFIEENAELLIWALNQDSSYGWGKFGLSTLYDGAKKVFGDKLGIQKSWLTGSSGDPRFNYFSKAAGIRAWPTSEPEKMKEPPPPLFNRPLRTAQFVAHQPEMPSMMQPNWFAQAQAQAQEGSRAQAPSATPRLTDAEIVGSHVWIDAQQRRRLLEAEMALRMSPAMVSGSISNTPTVVSAPVNTAPQLANGFRPLTAARIRRGRSVATATGRPRRRP